MRPRRAFVLVVLLSLFATTTAIPTAPTAEAQSSTDLLRIVITNAQVGAGNAGWAEFTTGRHWIDPTCRARLESLGATVAVVDRSEIDAMTPAPRIRCNQIVVPETGPGQPSTDLLRIVITTTKVAAGNDGWAEFTNGTKNWIDPTCRAQLESLGAQVAVLERSDILAIPTAPRLSCNQIVVPEPNPGQPSEAANVKLIRSNATRNTQFDNNQFRDVPMAQISISDLTVNADLYNERLLDTTNSGYFRVKCEVSHFAYDDPIVFPDQPGRAHLHMFFGNTEANAYSTFSSLMNTGTGTCNGADLNRTAYWVPALLDNEGNALIPYEIMVYYKNDNFRYGGANELVDPFPANLRMIAGNGAALAPQTTPSGGPNSQPVVSFSCGPAYNSLDLRQPLIPDCDGTGSGPFGANGRALEMQIAFRQCFDPAAGTYRTDQSHTSYSVGGYYGARCPDSHPQDLSSIMYRIFYSPDAYGGSLTDLHLSSDVKPGQILPGGTTAHADWFGAWHPGAMDMWIENCNNTQADCEIGLLRREPAVSLVPRQEGFYQSGYRAPAEDLIRLCPGKTLDPPNRLRSVSMCRMG